MDPKRIALTIDEAAAAVGIGRTLVFSEIKTGRLIARKVGRRTVILQDDLELWLAACPVSHLSGTEQ